MAAKGALAKENLIKRFATAVGEDYIGVEDKKYYFWSEENGEKVQVCLTLTVPKTPIKAEPNAINFVDEDGETSPALAPVKAVAMGEDEKATLNRLMKELGL